MAKSRQGEMGGSRQEEMNGSYRHQTREKYLSNFSQMSGRHEQLDIDTRLILRKIIL